MCKRSKRLAVLFIIAMAISSLTFLAVKNADATYTPSAPEFTVKYVDHSYDTPSTTYTTTDPFSGETKTHWQDGHHVINRTLDLTVKNQAYPSTVDGHGVKLQYTVQIKGHFEDDWSKYEVYSRTFDQTGEPDGYTQIAYQSNNNKAGDQIDVRVYAELVDTRTWPYEREASIIGDYSEIQTVSVPYNPVNVLTTFFPIIAAIVVIAVLVLVLKKNGKKANKVTSD